MPTIDQLVPAVVSADDDVLVVSQGGTARRITRSQLLAGMQPTLALTTGLMGRTSAGLGAPEHIAVGGGLRLVDGILSSPAPYSVTTLPVTKVSAATDLVPLSQGGYDRAVAVSTLLATSGIDVSGQIVKAALGLPRRLSDWAGDGIMVEAFGAVGDGVTDDTAAFARAVASGQPVRLGAKTYRIDGQWSISTSVTLIGTPGSTTILRSQQAGGAWINVTGTRFIAIGIIFDAGSSATDSWGLLITPSCNETLFQDCKFANNKAPNLGTGLTIQARDSVGGASSRHTVRACVFSNNVVHGLWIQAAAGALVESCSAFQNGQYGICLDFNDPTFQVQIRNSIVSGCRSWSNQRGISVGNYNETNLEPPRWGLANPDALDVQITSNVCFNNRAYGIAASGERIRIASNQVSCNPTDDGSSGILINATRSQVFGNTLHGPGQYGIDAGGCVECEISSNLIQSFGVGLNAGGGINNRVNENFLDGNVRGITACAVETDGNGGNFGLFCNGLSLERNTMTLTVNDGGGIYLIDGPSGVVIKQNAFIASVTDSPTRALFANTDTLMIEDNTWNGSKTALSSILYIDGNATIIAPEICDAVTVPSIQGDISGVIGAYQSAVSDQVTFIRITSGGSGYSHATIQVIGSGSGAQATAYVRDGAVIGAALQSGGSGYSRSVATVSILGDGQGAIATASIGLPVTEGKHLRLQCEQQLKFKSGTNNSTLENWTGTDITVPSGTEIIWTGVSGHWRATKFVAVDNVRPNSDGSLSISSLGGDISLGLGVGKAVRTHSGQEPAGFLSCFGRGSPEGVFQAPPGSDYRNLDGGAGKTLWVKITGNSSIGWAAIA